MSPKRNNMQMSATSAGGTQQQRRKSRSRNEDESDSEDDYSVEHENTSHRGNNSKGDGCDLNNDPINKEIIPDLRSISTLASSSVRTRIPEEKMNQEEKWARMETIYSNTDYGEDEDEFEVAKVKKMVRDNIFCLTKFCKGEGNPKAPVRPKPGKPKRVVLMKIGRTHELADVTQKRGYEYEVMKLCGLEEGKRTLDERCKWWKTYNYYVKYEIGQQRGHIQYMLRLTLTQGKLMKRRI